MASPAGPSRPGAGGASPSAASAADPILRNALRYTISAREYALLHRYVISRSRLLKRRAPTVDTVQRIMNGKPHDRRREAQSPDDGKAKGSPTGRPDGDDKSASEEERALGGADDYNARAIRHSLRVFVATGAAMKLWEIVSTKLMRKPQG